MKRDELVLEVVGTELFKAAGLGGDYEVHYLIAGLHARPSQILVHPRSGAADTPLPDGRRKYHVLAVRAEPTPNRSTRAAVFANAAESVSMGALARKVSAIGGEASQGRSKQ
eukprot:GFKZ01001559.1.p2 GENE.GFKZ01001559.1~~GFKZ01001559.1.p2  ORF type:complete len:112 (-),score=7.86 GFKZ01001559.1:162-497(-)